jgi:uncharacterized protein
MNQIIDLHPNIQLVQAYLEAAGRQDFAAAALFFSPALQYNAPGKNRFAGQFNGQQAALEYFGALMQATQGSYGVSELRDWMVSDDYVLLLAKEHAALGENKLDWNRLILFEVQGGKFSKINLFEDDQYAFDAFFGATDEAVGTNVFGDAGNVTPDAGQETIHAGALEDEKVKAVQTYQAAMARQDFAGGSTIFLPNVEYIVPGKNPLAGRYSGPEQVMGYFGRLMQETNGSYAISHMIWLASQTRVGLVTRNHASRNGSRLAWDEVIVFEFENGKKRRIDLFSGDQYAVDDFFAERP